MPYALPDAAHTLGQTAATQSAALARSANFKPNQLLLCAASKAVSETGKKGVQRERERDRKKEGEQSRDWSVKPLLLLLLLVSQGFNCCGRSARSRLLIWHMTNYALASN